MKMLSSLALIVTSVLTLAAPSDAQVLTPAKSWVAPGAPLNVTVKAEADARLVLTDFGGARLAPKEAAGAEVGAAEATKDLKQVFAQVSSPGTYVLYVVPKGKELPEFLGTPLVVNVRDDRRRGAPAGAMVTKVEPLRYALMSSKQGAMTMTFYYDVAPNTAASFLRLAEQGFFDGLTFHRIVPGFVIQGGDPRGDGTGGPGYQIDAEFNDRPHEKGVLSMARNGDPMEQTGAMPRCEFANSAGSQFFVCLDYQRTKALDRKYTAFGKVTEGMNAVGAIAGTPLADPEAGRPKDPPVIEKVEVKAVTAQENPYAAMMRLGGEASK